jgi:hypothetical protein
VLTIGSPTASQQVLFVLRKAEEAKKARLPVAVHYMVSGCGMKEHGYVIIMPDLLWVAANCCALHGEQVSRMERGCF